MTQVVLTRIHSCANDDIIATIGINRPEVANAFSNEVIQGLTDAVRKVRELSRLRAVVVTGYGKHFSAGADLNWMKDSAKLDRAANVTEAKTLATMFEEFAAIPVPLISVIRGAVYGGAVGLVAVSDIAIAEHKARFCLSEVRLGLLPAIILPYLGRKMLPGALTRLGLSARVFDCAEAREAGLVQVSGKEEELDALVTAELNQLLQCSREAQERYKKLLVELRSQNFAQTELTVETIAEVRTSTFAQSGLNAFFAKDKAPWTTTLNKDWSPDEGE